MKRSFLHWFYLAVQFVMLAVSIPKVAMLFHAYDAQPLGPPVGGVDIRSWLVGIAIDLTATFTTWAAMARYDETRKRSALFAPAFIILVCTALSVIANYEDAATLRPDQYASVALFAQPAQYVNPILISAPPLLVLLLIVLVPSVLARPRIKSASEIELEAAEAEARINAGARLREAKALANARVRSAQLGGLADNFSQVAVRTGLTKTAHPESEEPRTPTPNDRALDVPETPIIPAPDGRASRAMWNTMTLKDRVVSSGLISAQEVSEVLAVSLTRARELVKGVHTADSEKRTVYGRSGVPFQPLIDALYEKKTRESFAQAQKLEKALGLRKRQRPLQAVPGDDAPEPVAEEQHEAVKEEVVREKRVYGLL